MPLALRARLGNRSYWTMLYADGRIVEEPECDWLDAPTRGRRRLRLVCPNSQVAELEARDDGPGGTGRFFQLKVAVRSMGGRSVRAHVIGRLDGTDGACRCYAWEPAYRDETGRMVAGRLVTFTDNAYQMQYEQIGPLATEPLGLARA